MEIVQPASFTFPDFVSKIFAPLISRWTTFFEWRYSRPWRHWKIYTAQSFSGNFPNFFIIPVITPPSQSINEERKKRKVHTKMEMKKMLEKKEEQEQEQERNVRKNVLKRKKKEMKKKWKPTLQDEVNVIRCPHTIQIPHNSWVVKLRQQCDLSLSQKAAQFSRSKPTKTINNHKSSPQKPAENPHWADLISIA